MRGVIHPLAQTAFDMRIAQNAQLTEPPASLSLAMFSFGRASVSMLLKAEKAKAR